MKGVFSVLGELPEDFKPSQLPSMPWPASVLMCRPEHFEVVDVKNPFMEGQIGKVDRAAALRQWEGLKAAFEGAGLTVELIKPVPGLEDMVFCANQTLPGLDPKGRKVCILSHMKHPSRRREVPAFADWFKSRGHRIESVGPAEALFEGCGDAIWHPGRRLLWGGCGPRTEKSVYSGIAKLLDVPVITLELRTTLFYHLDTCFCPIDEKTVLVYPPSLAPESLALIRKAFRDVIEVEEKEAMELMACNAAAFFGTDVVIQSGCEKVNRELSGRGFDVVEVETGEFMKSGGSVFCLKMSLF